MILEGTEVKLRVEAKFEIERNIGNKHHFSQPPRFGILDMHQQELCFKVLVGGWVICYFFLRAYFDGFMELTLVVNFT